MEVETGEWHECIVDHDYEINDAYPYPIRRKGSDKIVKEHVTSCGYARLTLNDKHYQKHRIVAQQFISNDDPTYRREIDHIDHNKLNNHITNLRWCSRSENERNKTSHNGIQYEYVDAIDDDAIAIDEYANHFFDFYYYVEDDDAFYHYNGVQYRKLHVNIDKRNDSAFVYARDIDDKPVKIYLNRFKRLYNIDY